MYIPSDYYREFKAYCEEEFQNNNGIYDSFTDEQVEVIKDYFRWRSKRRVHELCRNTTLAVKPKKAEILSSLMGGATDWEYDGCVDMGYFGGGRCDLGHTLRYEHYAYSPSTGRRLVFGVNCASDFFGIEPEKLRKISEVQSEVLEEIKFIAFIINTGRHREYINKEYGDLVDIIAAFRDRLNEVFGYEWNQMMGAFLKVKLPLTPSMLNRIEYVRSKFYNKYLASKKKLEALAPYIGNDKEIAGSILTGTWHELFYTKVILDTVLGNNKYEAKQKSAMLRLGAGYHKAHALLKQGKVDIIQIARSGAVQVYKVKTQKGIRLATKSEISDNVVELFVERIPIVKDEEYKMISIFAWGENGLSSFYEQSGCENGHDNAEKVVKSSKLMVDAIRWVVNNVEYLKSIEQKLNNKSGNLVEYPDSADDGSITTPIKDALMRLYRDPEVANKASVGGFYSTVLDICKRHALYGYELSPKQAAVIRKAYLDMYSNKVEAKAQSGELDIMKKIELLLKNKDLPEMKKHQFAFQVIETVKKYGRVSDKQRNVIERAYKALEQALGQGSVFIENNSKQPVTVISTYDEDKNSVFENRATKKRIGAGFLGNIPSISEMSQALGLGMLKSDDKEAQ